MFQTVPPRRLKRTWRLPWFLVVVAALLAGHPAATSSAQATTTVCPSGCPFSTIQAAIDAASDGATITVAPGTYQENLRITKSLMIVGDANDQPAVPGGYAFIDGGKNGSVVTVNPL